MSPTDSCDSDYPNDAQRMVVEILKPSLDGDFEI